MIKLDRPTFNVLLLLSILIDTQHGFLLPTKKPTADHLFAVQEGDEGIVLGEKYILKTDGEQSTSGKSTLVEVAPHPNQQHQQHDPEADEGKQRLLVKFSDNIKALKREVKNYKKVTNEETKDLFVEIHDFYNPQEKGLDNHNMPQQQYEPEVQTSYNDQQTYDTAVPSHEYAQQYHSSMTASSPVSYSSSSPVYDSTTQQEHAGSMYANDFDPTRGGTFFDPPTQSIDESATYAPSTDQESSTTYNQYTNTSPTQQQNNEELPLKGQAALVMEKGTQDLRSFLEENGPLYGIELQHAVARTARALKACHAQKLVWTELKSTNFIIQQSDEQCQSQQKEYLIKAIDLESAVPKGERPIDFSPEAIPPEFAEAYMYEKEADMEMQKSFDIFSLGLLFYELATGELFWQQQCRGSNQKDFVMKIAYEMKNRDHLCLEHAESIDPTLKELIGQCLRVNPEERPKIDDVLAHPYIEQVLN